MESALAPLAALPARIFTVFARSTLVYPHLAAVTAVTAARRRSSPGRLPPRLRSRPVPPQSAREGAARMPRDNASAGRPRFSNLLAKLHRKSDSAAFWRSGARAYRHPCGRLPCVVVRRCVLYTRPCLAIQSSIRNASRQQHQSAES